MRAYPDIDFRVYPYGPIYVGDTTYLGHIPTQTKLVQWTKGAPISGLYIVANLVNAQWLGGRKDVLNFLPELAREVFLSPEYALLQPSSSGSLEVFDPLNFNRADFSILGQALAARDGVKRGDIDPETGEYTEKALKAAKAINALPSKAPVSDVDATEEIRLDLIEDWVRMNFCFETEESYYLACDLVEAELIDPDDVQLFSDELLVRNVQNTRKEILSLPGSYLRSRLRKTED